MSRRKWQGKRPPWAHRPEWLDEYTRLKRAGHTNSEVADMLAGKGYTTRSGLLIDTSSMRSAVNRWARYGECAAYVPDRKGRHFGGSHAGASGGLGR